MDRRKKQFCLKNYFSFSTSDPYYLLGVDRRAEFDEIKKQYFKLAAEYHPDKNKSPDASKKFMAIKEAFEMIKTMKGKNIKLEFEQKSWEEKAGFESVRPNPEQYDEDFKDGSGTKEEDSKDYQEYAYKTPEGEEFDKFKTSFQTIHDINDIKFRPDDVDIPDPSKRFHLENRVKLKNFSDNSGLFMAFVIGFFGVIFFFINKAHNSAVLSRYEINLYNLLNRKEYEVAKSEEESLLEITTDVKRSKDFKKFNERLEEAKSNEEYKRSHLIPMMKPFVSASDAEEEEKEKKD